jgi:copper(I)-binding protein
MTTEKIMRWLLLMLLLTPGLAFAQPNTVRVTDPFARAAAAGRTGAVYLTIQGGPDRLIGASTDVAAHTAVHETIMENGVMSMRPVAGVMISPGAATRLAPGGLHIMLVDLTRALKDGESFVLTLTFERAGKMTVTVPVARAGATPQPNAAVPGMMSPGTRQR